MHHHGHAAALHTKTLHVLLHGLWLGQDLD
jgi:hypothetical protein